MKTYRIEDMKGGWFVGNFDPTAFKTDKCEICYKFHEKGSYWDPHYHKIAAEVTLVVSGEIQINDKVFKSGDIFVMEPGEIVYPVFIEDCVLVIMKTPSVINDKYCIE